ncbi:MAG: pyridoxamine 5'-phosphate oxidase family protein [Sulfuritalea sp.]|nr:pyridoxamine 5'-phosphate oxidase family protein [Sulfuritalea sp.]
MKTVGDPSSLVSTPRTKLKRRADRGSLDRATINAILDEALVCHVGFVEDGAPVVLPTCPWRMGDWLYVHGAAGSSLIANFAGASPLCVSLALIEGLVFARSALRHSLHYRSVVLFGRGEAVVDPAHKNTALLGLVEKLSPGRSSLVRPPSAGELAATGVARVRIDEGGAKIAASPPGETDVDQPWQVWSGTVPLDLRAGASVPSGNSVGLDVTPLPLWLVSSPMRRTVKR